MFCLINVLLLNNSCHHTSGFPESYTILFNNGYFEDLCSVEIGGQRTENIAVDEDGAFENIGPGTYLVVVITHSQLRIEAPVTLTGLNPVVRIIINSTGKMALEDIL
jgi:hypothetical protein